MSIDRLCAACLVTFFAAFFTSEAGAVASEVEEGGATVYLEATHDQSKLGVFVEDTGEAVWAYLSPLTDEVSPQATLFNRREPNAEDEFFEGSALPAVVVSKEGKLDRAPSADTFSVKWSKHGQAVAVLYAGKPRAILFGFLSGGFTRALKSEFASQRPWSEEIYKKIFVDGLPAADLASALKQAEAAKQLPKVDHTPEENLPPPIPE